MDFFDLPALRTPRLVLRKLERTDLPLYYQRLFSSPKVARYMLWQPHTEIAQSAAALEAVLTRYEAGTCCRWAITLNQDDSLIGILELLRFEESTHTCSFAYMLGEDFWGQGYATEALEAAFRFAFTKLGVSAIEADHFVENAASGVVMRKAGMQYLRTIPGKYEKQGILHDAMEYRITAEEWQEKSRC